MMTFSYWKFPSNIQSRNFNILLSMIEPTKELINFWWDFAPRYRFRIDFPFSSVTIAQ